MTTRNIQFGFGHPSISETAQLKEEILIAIARLIDESPSTNENVLIVAGELISESPTTTEEVTITNV